MKLPFKRFASITGATLALSLWAAGTAWAARPANLAGTTWTVQANRDVVQLVITTQGGAGAPGAATCRHINGSIGIAPIKGWYCPASGRIHFQHRNLASGNAERVFTGNVSDDVIGQTLYMAGSMTVLDPVFGDLGEYNFSATR
jgi:hypothetical protein